MAFALPFVLGLGANNAQLVNVGETRSVSLESIVI